MNNFLSMHIEHSIVSRTISLFKEKQIEHIFPSFLIRESIFDLLERYSTVLYWPLENDNNQGCHVNSPSILNSLEQGHYVYINTAQTLEKQAFSAAHELGHVWKIEEYILNKHPELENNDEIREAIVDRFAAVLLMPETSFIAAIDEWLKKNNKGKEVLHEFGFDFFNLVAYLLHRFYAPWKAIFRRMVELGFFEWEHIAPFFCDNENNLLKTKTDIVIDNFCSINGYTWRHDGKNRRWIKDLPNLLKCAEEQKLVPQKVIDNIRVLYKLPRLNDTEMISSDFSKELLTIKLEGNIDDV